MSRRSGPEVQALADDVGEYLARYGWGLVAGRRLSPLGDQLPLGANAARVRYAPISADLISSGRDDRVVP
jgi:hypothetical protein